MEVRIIISPDGKKTTVEAVGYSGPSCEEATKAIEEAIGAEEARERKPEYYQTISASPSIHVR